MRDFRVVKICGCVPVAADPAFHFIFPMRYAVPGFRDINQSETLNSGLWIHIAGQAVKIGYPAVARPVFSAVDNPLLAAAHGSGAYQFCLIQVILYIAGRLHFTHVEAADPEFILNESGSELIKHSFSPSGGGWSRNRTETPWSLAPTSNRRRRMRGLSHNLLWIIAPA